jgi:polyribonucleotide nucleotidyltransferase
MQFKTKIGKQELEVSIGDLAIQASGSCLIKLGKTTILATAQMGEERQGLDFFPLSCEYEERYYAAGKILGSRFIRREGRPSTEAILISRAVDRSIRPLFPKELKNEVQVIATCLSWDGENDPAILALLGSSFALSVSEIPWQGPIGAVRVSKVSNGFVLNPDYKTREEAELELVVSGVEEKGEILVNMIELQGEEIQESDVLKAIEFAKPFLKELISFQKEIKEKVGKEKLPLPAPFEDKELKEKVLKLTEGKITEALYQKEKLKRQRAFEQILEEVLANPELGLEELPFEEKNRKISYIKKVLEGEKRRIMRENVLSKEKRVDGRKIDQLREISAEVAVLPRTHGSGLFTRGETKALSILTLGSPSDQQLLEGMEISGKKRFLHHYNFPPYSVGETRPLRGPGRREIGHGMLAEKALFPLIPKFEDFPYTIRVVSEIVSSNGSTSMASVSAACLALMDGGVPIKRPAAGIAIGLITEEGKELENYKILTDIQGPEDSQGDMDFKVAGTSKGITAIQMDIKIRGLSDKMIKEALERAKKARLEILEIQSKALPQPRKELSIFAPRVYTININPEKIGMVIGPGGRTINEIIEDCGVSIEIEESGKVFVTAENEEAAKKAVQWIKNLTQEVKVGEIFQGKVKRIFEFGAVVEILPGQEGLVHISEFADFRVRKISDFLKVGDIIPVKVINIDEQGKISLSAKQAGFQVPSSLLQRKRPPSRFPKKRFN